MKKAQYESNVGAERCGGLLTTSHDELNNLMSDFFKTCCGRNFFCILYTFLTTVYDESDLPLYHGAGVTYSTRLNHFLTSLNHFFTSLYHFLTSLNHMKKLA